MQAINAILGSELNIDSELTEAQMELLCGGEDVEEWEDVDSNRSSERRESYEVCEEVQEECVS